MKIERRGRAVSAIDEAHTFSSRVGAFVEVERELDVVTRAFSRDLRFWLCLRLREGSLTKEDTEEDNNQTKTLFGSSSVSSVVQITSH